MGNARKLSTLLAAAGFMVSGAAQAALHDRGGGLIYDDVLNVTWLQDANYAKTVMNWGEANTWAANLVYHDGVRRVDYLDWRLPTALNRDGSGPCGGYGCSDSEMGYMYYKNMGASAHGSILAGTNTANLALFTNLQSNLYWSGTAYAPYPGYAWAFGTSLGYQGGYDQGFRVYAWAVRDGDVAAVPEPETYAMFLAGLAVMGGALRRRADKAG